MHRTVTKSGLIQADHSFGFATNEGRIAQEIDGIRIVNDFDCRGKEFRCLGMLAQSPMAHGFEEQNSGISRLGRDGFLEILKRRFIFGEAVLSHPKDADAQRFTGPFSLPGKSNRLFRQSFRFVRISQLRRTTH